MVQNPGFQFRKYCRTCGSEGLRGWRHGIRRAHKVTIDLGASYRKQRTDTMAPTASGKNLIVCETPPGFHASLGRVKPCTLESRKMRDFVPVRTFLGVTPERSDESPLIFASRSKRLSTTSAAAGGFPK